jgi:membrane protein DedA with SNARE-associated domain
VAQLVSAHSVWLVALFIGLESIGIPLPAEAALIAAAFFAAKHGLDIWPLVTAGVLAAIAGEIVGFWIGRTFGHQLLHRHGPRFGLTAGRIRIGQWLFVRYGGRFVFAARFLPFLRNMAAVLAGTNAMVQHSFYFASATAAAAWVFCYGLGAYSLGHAFATLASPATIGLGVAAAVIILAIPAVVLQYEERLLAKAEGGLRERSLAPQSSDATPGDELAQSHATSGQPQLARYKFPLALALTHRLTRRRV